MDTAALRWNDACLDQVLLFILLHEQPPRVREQTLQEAIRILKPDDRLVVVDCSRSAWWNRLSCTWRPLIWAVEPFA